MLAIQVPTWMPLRGGAHQLGGGHHVVVDLGGEDRVEAGRLGLPGDGLDLLPRSSPHPGRR